jgi:hypothetical protein
MPHIAELLTTERPDADGIIHIGRNTPGCRHCGHRDMKYSENGRVCLHHPGTTCCAKAVKDQIGWREQELADLRRAAREYQDEMRDTERIAGSTVGADAVAARNKLAKMQAAYPVKVERWRRLTDGDPQTGDMGLKPEIDELRSILAVMERAA